MRLFGGVDLIQERMREIFNPPKRSIFKQRHNPRREYVEIELRASEDDIFRANVLLDDISRIAGTNSQVLSLEGLISILYYQFIECIVQGEVDGLRIDLYQLSVNIQDQYHALVYGNRSDMQLNPVSANRLSLQQSPEQPRRARGRMYKVFVSMIEAEAFRGEVVLEDMKNLNPDFFITLQQLLSMLFAQFVAAIRNGNQKEVLEQIIEDMGRLL